MKALDLFRGAGGWSVACQHLGIEDHGVEIMAQANETATAAGHRTVGHNVWNYDLNVTNEYDGLIASPPCQTFSAAGKGKGRKALDDVLQLIAGGAWKDMDQLRDSAEALGDERTALVLTPLHYWWRMQPEWVCLEQVPTVLPVWEAMVEVLRAHGYFAWAGNLQAEQYGVPQTRKRAFLIAHRTKIVDRPEATHSRYYSRNPSKFDEGVRPWISMAEALGWGLSERPSPTITGGGTETGGAEPIAKLARYTERSDWSYRNNPMPNQAVRTMDQPAPTLSFGHQLPEWCFNRPASTIVGTRRSSTGMLVGRSLADGSRRDVGGHDGSVGLRSGQLPGVRVTVEEAGILQSFPRDYPWQGAKTKQYLQVGNAVPPFLAKAVLREVV